MSMRCVLGALIVMLFVGCAGDPVGDPCVQEQFPVGGYNPAETYVELSSPECQTRVCLVTGLRGDPRADCTEGCASDQERRDHVYCSCRCDEGGTTAPCACPEGFACEDTGYAGFYCVRDVPGEL